MPPNVINSWRTFCSSTLNLVQVPRDSAGGIARRAARRIAQLPPPTCQGLILAPTIDLIHLSATVRLPQPERTR